MKSKLLILALVTAGAVSCNSGARLTMQIEGLGKGDEVVLERLNVNVCETVDTIALDSKGTFTHRLAVAPGNPEFFYVTRDGVRLTSLLAAPKEHIRVNADTLGHWTVFGSEGSERMRVVEADFSAFLEKFYAAGSAQEASRIYIDYYRSRVKYVLNNSTSLTVVPVLFQQISPTAPIFSQTTDALHFRSVCDTLKTVYPNSRYVRLLEKEAVRRENILNFNSVMQKAKQVGFPDLALPGIDGQKVALSGIDSKAILVHFWTTRDAAQTILGEDVLKPIYRDFHKRGLEIYSVCIDVDKAKWATIVRNQALPWINVCDGLGASSPAIRTYAVGSLPSSILIANGEVSSAVIDGEKSLRKELSKIL